MKTWIKHAFLLTMDEKDTVLKDGCLFIDEDKIAYIGSQDDAMEAKAERIIDAKGNIIMPGLVNAHTHLPMTIFKGYGEGLPLQQWLTDKIWPAEAKLNDEIVYWSSMLGLIEMAKTGTTCFLDMYMFYDAVFKAMKQSGHRGVLARAVLDADGNLDYRIKEAEDVLKRYKSNGRVDAMVSAHAEYTCSTEALKKVLELAQKYEAGIHVHISETQEEHEQAIERHGMTPIQLIHQMGLTQVPVAAAHCVHVSDQDVDIMAEKNISVLSCPQSNLKLGSGIAPLKKMADAGINIAIGTDGSSSNNNLDMLEETMLASMLQKGVLMDASVISNMQALKMATVGGAKALGLADKIGQIKPGYQADIIMIDTSGIAFQPQNDVISCTINSGNGRDVAMTMVAGDIIYENDEIRFADEFEVIRRVQMFADAICI